MKKFIGMCFFLTAMIAGAFSQETENKFTFSRSQTVLALGMGFDSKGNNGFTFMIKNSSFFGDSPFYMGFQSFGGAIGTDSVFESGLHTGIAGPLFSNKFGGEAYLGLNFGGRVDTVLNLFEVDSPSVLMGIALAFPYENDWDLALHFNSLVRPYTIATGNWDFVNTYFNLYISFNLKSRTEGRATKWSDGLKDQ